MYDSLGNLIREQRANKSVEYWYNNAPGEADTADYPAVSASPKGLICNISIII